METISNRTPRECHEAGCSIMECACWYRTARIAKEISPFEAGQYVSVEWTRTAYNHKFQRYEDLFKVWSGSGKDHWSELFAGALDSFCL